jgi:TctA family transporter
MTYTYWLLLGTLYGFIIGVIPVAGTATGLVAVYGIASMFLGDPYALVVFTTAIVVSSTVGDSFSSVMMNIPGAAGAAATMVDGFPMARRGEAARALMASVTTSTFNGVLWGALVFFSLPLYSQVIMSLGIPEMLAFILLAFTCIAFVNSEYWFRGILALCAGIFLGLVGENPITTGARFTGGWDYLKAGIQITPVLAGFMAVPELWEAYQTKAETIHVRTSDIWKQIKQGIADSWTYRWDGIRGGAIGAFIGILPGIGGSIADWLAYGQTVARGNRSGENAFGSGNVRGVIGCEGANNAQKATAYVPAVLFGIPAAPFEAIIISLFMMVGIELGSPQLLVDMKFFDTLAASYFASMVITFGLSVWFIRYASKIMNVPFRYYFWPILALLVWSCVQYTGYWEDYVMFVLCSAAGMIFKHFKLSRAAVIIGFVLADRAVATFIQFNTLYSWTDMFTRPVSLILVTVAIGAAVYGVFFNKVKINYV